MALNPSIILAGQPVDAIGAMGRGTELAAQTNALRTQNDLANLYRTQGAGILAGDQGALNALAGIDPMSALQVQSTRQGIRMNEEQLKLSYENARLRGLEYAATLDERARQEEAAKLEQGLSGAAFFYQKGDRAGYEAFLAQNGLDPAQFPFEAFPAHAAGIKGAMDALKTFTPAEVSPQDRFKVVGTQLYDLSAEGGPRVVGEAPGQTETIFGPDGQPILQRGPASGVKFTEAQAKDTVFATRAEGALAKLEPVADALVSRTDTVLNMLPLGIGREAQGDDFQVARQAADEFLQAILRKDTGAAITADEQALYGVTYLPQPGDNQAVLQAKREARARAIAALQAGMNADQFAATDRAQVEAARRVEGATTTAPAPTVPQPSAPIPPGAVDLLRQNDTPEYRAMFDEVFGAGAAARAMGGN